MAACIRPQRSLIYGASRDVVTHLHEGYMPPNMTICDDEAEVAELLGPFLLEKEKDKNIPIENNQSTVESIGSKLERRRIPRMHVALPLELTIHPREGNPIVTKAIATNISEGGLFAEYLDLDAARLIERIEPLKEIRTEIDIFPRANFPDEYHIAGQINRKVLRKKQLGLAVEFVGGS